MTTWQIIILASIAVLGLKILGYLVPQSLVSGPTPTRVTSLLTVALLSALIIVQTLGSGHGIAVDARVPALLVAAGLLAVRAPFIVVIAAAAATAALIRAFT